MEFEKVLSELIEKAKASDNNISAKEIINYYSIESEEYDNIIFVISKGWNQYQFETYAPMINGSVSIPRGKEASYERNRNLFYVCCSRPKKRLVFFVSVPMTAAFRGFLSDLVGDENILTYSEYIDRV